MANLLVHESSPYLLQHAHNPVNWRAWNDESLALAKAQNKLILVSIGYSACHWCHVMEKQCFENEEAARLMNKHFICIKVDREERPDIDAVYMHALQLMSGQGGWPLNCFTLPDGQPVYGGTYFPLEKWMAVLENLQDLFETNLSSMEDYAARLMNGMQQAQLYVEPSELQGDYNALLFECVTHWKKHLDYMDGGTNRVPKFPMPCNYLFLLSYSHTKKDNELLSHVYLTLNKMSMGGIFDQLGGGFARYSTDGIWKAPHFEKMLYDNAQLISLYSKAYQLSKDVNYKEVIEKTLEFIQSEFTGSANEFYSALDADSEGEEGKYYVWKKEELQLLLNENYELFSSYYNINELGHWEHGNYILMRTDPDEDFSKKHALSSTELAEHKKNWRAVLLAFRKKRVTPGLDDKTLTSWNALMIKACCDAFLALGSKASLAAALGNANFIVKQQLYGEQFLYHAYKKGKSTINGFLEDYACTAESFIQLYSVTGNEEWLKRANLLTGTALEYFYDRTDGLFYFNSIKDTPLIARQKEVQDNVIPASNSVMATVLYQLGIYFEKEDYIDMSKKMCAHFYDEINHYGSAYANWAMLLLRFEMPVLQLAIPEKEYEETISNIQRLNSFNVFPYCANADATLPFIQDKKGSEKFYLCSNKNCGLPLNNRNELITALGEVQAIN